MQPLRSALYMPGANARALDKARGLPTDAVIMDLEDSVAPEAKVEARARVCDALQQGVYGKRLCVVRINALDTNWGVDDLQAVVKVRPNAVLVPKVSDAASVANIETAMSGLGAASETALWLMMETPRAVLNAGEIAASAHEPGSRMTTWVMGTNDLAKELRCEMAPGREALRTSLSLCVLAARAGGLHILDGVFNNIQDTSAFEAECREGRALGFDGKSLIHPSQVEPCNRLFSPSADDIAWARKVVAAMEEAEAAGKGVVTVDGEMVEGLHAEQAKRILATVEAGGAGDLG